jgi:hypothetical protein
MEEGGLSEEHFLKITSQAGLHCPGDARVNLLNNQSRLLLSLSVTVVFLTGMKRNALVVRAPHLAHLM